MGRQQTAIAEWKWRREIETDNRKEGLATNSAPSAASAVPLRADLGRTVRVRRLGARTGHVADVGRIATNFFGVRLFVQSAIQSSRQGPQKAIGG